MKAMIIAAYLVCSIDRDHVYLDSVPAYPIHLQLVSLHDYVISETIQEV